MQQNLDMKFYSKNSPKSGYTWETEPDKIPDSQIAETLEADVIIIGAGISGLAASARCSAKGLKCITLDKNQKMTAVAGQFAAINTKCMAELGLHVDKKQLAADWLKVSGSRVEEELLWLFIDRSAEGFEWMLSLTDGEVYPKVYVGYKGPMFNEYLATHHIYLKEGSTAYKNGGGGLLACEILENEFTKNGGQMFRSTSALYLEKDANGRVVSCIAKNDTDGTYRRFVGTKAVVLATGDCSDNQEMLEAFCPIGTRAPKQFKRPGNTGDGQMMAYWAGAALDNPEWAPTLHVLGYSGLQFFFLHVNRLGKRFMNEDTWMQAKSIRCMMQPGGDYCWSIFDGKFLDEISERWDILGGQGMTPHFMYGDPIDRKGIMDFIEKSVAGKPVREGREVTEINGFQADTIEDLAKQIDVPVDALLASVNRYNELVAQGDDTDFGKRSIMLTPIVKPPFYALRWGPSLLDIFGGALTNKNLNVIGADSNTIPGLYAVGNAAGGMYAVDYPLLLNGNSYGRALAYCMQLADVISG